MSENIRVLIVDDLPETRENVRKLLQFEPEVDVIGQAGTGEQAIEMAQELKPDIILMDINMPGVDGIGASQTISELVPHSQIIIMSVQSDADYLRRAMLAGARDFLTKPFGGDELITAIRRVHQKRPAIAAPSRTGRTGTPEDGRSGDDLPPDGGKVVTVFSPKGGSGCTTISINLAVSLAKQGYRTVLVDGSLQFGDVAVMLNLKSVTTLVDVIERINELDTDFINSVVQVHKSGLHVLLSPPRPEMADVVTEEHIKTLVELLREMYDFVVIDTSSALNDVALTILDTADRILLVTQQNLPSLKNISRFFDLSNSLEYEPQKVWMVVNRATSKQGISVKDIENTLKRPVMVTIPASDLVCNTAANEGIPVVTGSGQKQPVGVALLKMAERIAQDSKSKKATADATAGDEEKGLFGWLFKRSSAGG
ncbi:MAG: response regulator [Chloroflexota bacterium]|jgi:pilus assembly protein CpaE